MADEPGLVFPRVEVPDAAAERLVYFATFAADHELLKPRQASRVRGPDGEVQGETAHEIVTRIVTAAVLHLVEIGLLVVPGDLDARLDRYLPMTRDDGR